MKICSECHGEFQDTVSRCPTDNIALESQHVNPLIGSCLADRYHIISMLGSGGTGVVYKAQHLKMDKPVAVKMMHSHMMSRPDALRSFYDEAKTVAQLKHHNIVTLYDFGISTTNQPFLVMDYIEGPSLRKYIEMVGPLSLEKMRPVVAQIVDGLAYAHAEGVVHQDLKPENIMLANIDQAVDKVTLVDFGLATLSSSDKDMAMPGKKKKFIGSPYYMSPEQCLSNTAIDFRSDIYSLAIVLYEALSDKLPFERKSAMAMMDSHVRETPNPFKSSNADLLGLQACTELTRVFSQAMAKEPDNRYKSIEEFGIALDDALARDSVKLKAIRHRSFAAEQVLVHARQTNHTIPSYQTLNMGIGEASNSQLECGTQFLSRQAEIEEAYLSNSGRIDAKISKNIQKGNIIAVFLEKLRAMCDSQRSRCIAPNLVQQTSECPNCKSLLKPGIQFCLSCQRNLTPLVRATKLSESRSGNTFAYHSADISTLEEQQAARTKLQNLRQQKTVILIRIQHVLNYALIITLIISGIIVIQRYLNMTISVPNLGRLLSPNRAEDNTVTTNPSH